MTWLEKMDAVLKGLFALKANNPKFEDLQSWLKANYPEVDKGEIEDITLYLWREQMMYFETGGKRLSEYNDLDPNGRYLISCKGKLLYEGEGGFGKREQRKIRAATLQFWQTWAIAIGTVAAGIYGLFEIYRMVFC
ncbi:MAG: hypothetical protein JNK98_02185 [Chitinophagaceae bacterium]|nr:hypothetical protein [Chitinophagaceae bacterium]